jgi:replicative DNA helicase
MIETLSSKVIEDCVLGTMIRDPEFATKVSPKLNEEDFNQTCSKIVLRHVLAQILKNGSADYAMVIDSLKRAKEYKNEIGVYMAEILGMADSTDPSHIATLKDYANRRKTFIMAENLKQQALDLSTDHKKNVEDAHSGLFSLVDPAGNSGPVHVAFVLSKLMPDLEARHRTGTPTGIKTGLTDIDRVTGGMQPGELIIVAGRPSMGKTALAECIAAQVAAQTGVVFFSQEMGASQLAMRDICRESGVEMRALQTVMSKNDFMKISPAIGIIADRKLWIDDTSGVSIVDIISGVSSIHKEQISLIIVDYIQLMKMSDKRQSREQGLSEISRLLKNLARNTNTTVLALAQLSREVERREDKRPMMSDLRESGAIEQDADKILLIYRDDYYNAESDKKGISEVIIAKNRNGQTGTVLVGFEGRKMRFYNLDNDHKESVGY